MTPAYVSLYWLAVTGLILEFYFGITEPGTPEIKGVIVSSNPQVEVSEKANQCIYFLKEILFP